MFGKLKSFFKRNTKLDVPKVQDLPKVQEKKIDLKSIENFLLERDFPFQSIQVILNKFSNFKDDSLKDKEKLKIILANNIKIKNNIHDLEKKMLENPISSFMIFGINGSGKTTSIGKLIHYFEKKFPKILLVACDQFRAAATEQLAYWAKLKSKTLFTDPQNKKHPGAILHDALSFAVAKNVDLILIDTAGRLHNKKNLMQELKKLYSIAQKKLSNGYLVNILVLDAHLGKNALLQVKEFNAIFPIDGIILSKTDSSSTGAIVFSILEKFQIPIYFLGHGEKIEDLKVFNMDQYINDLLISL